MRVPPPALSAEMAALRAVCEFERGTRTDAVSEKATTAALEIVRSI